MFNVIWVVLLLFSHRFLHFWKFVFLYFIDGCHIMCKSNEKRTTSKIACHSRIFMTWKVHKITHNMLRNNNMNVYITYIWNEKPESAPWYDIKVVQRMWLVIIICTSINYLNQWILNWYQILFLKYVYPISPFNVSRQFNIWSRNNRITRFLQYSIVRVFVLWNKRKYFGQF